jgi:arylsulfatase
MNSSDSDFKGHIGTTVADSVPHWPEGKAKKAPNVLLVIFDDTGWSDFGCFGSEIATPTIDKLAAEGLRYNNFHVTPLCSPTRACVLTGRNHHAIGMRFLADVDTGFPNSRGRIRADVPTMPGMLQKEGYSTYLVGKWHLTPRHEITPAGPYKDWPLARGFDKFYGFLEGVADHYAPELVRDNQAIEPPATKDYHLSVDLVDRALAFVNDHATYMADRPFFLQLAFGATHAPFQAPREVILPYVKTFEKGWDQTREDRLQRQREAGLVPTDTPLTERNPGVSAWADLTDDAKLLYTHLQAAFAGFLEHADTQLGRLIQGLETLGLRDDTVVIVMSDNGASREGGQHGAVDINGPYSGHRMGVAEQLASLHLIGGPDGPAHYPEGWAMVGNTPFRRFKQFTDLGGVRSPMVVSWPNGIKAHGEIRNQFVHAVDIAPTILSLIGASDTPEFDGKSFGDSFSQAHVPAARQTQYWETLGHRAIWHDGWKAVTEHHTGIPFEQDAWRLYNTVADFAEARDVASQYPEKLAELTGLWWEEAKRHQVLPLDERNLVELITLKTPLGMYNRRRIVLRPGQAAVPFATRLTGSDRSMQAIAHVQDFHGGHEGVLLASGSSIGGYSFYVQAGVLHFEHLCLGQRVVCKASKTSPIGNAKLGFKLTRGAVRSAIVELLHDDEVVGRAEIPHTSGHLSFFGLAAGSDPISQVSTAYQGDYAFPHEVLNQVIIDYLDLLEPHASASMSIATE